MHPWSKLQGHPFRFLLVRLVQFETCSVSPTIAMGVTRDEQYAALKFYFSLNKSSAEAYTMLQEAYGEFVLPYSTAQRWYKLFNPYSAKGLGDRLYATLHKMPGEVGYSFYLFLKS